VPVGASFLFNGGLDRAMPADMADDAAATSEAALASGRCMLLHHPAAEGELEVLYMPIRAPLRLLIIGATPDAEPVSRIAGLLGWQVTVVEPRSAWCNPARFPDAAEVSVLDADAFAARLKIEEYDAALLLARNFAVDAAFLRPLAGARVPFVGILGSKSRCARLLEGLGGDARKLKGRVHGPVGLELQAETPEEIALSIVAQVQATWDRRRAPAGRNDAGRKLPVHAVVLAAGGSKRFGGFKQLLEFQGESLLRRAAGLAGAVLPGRVIVVHGPKPLKCRRELAGLDLIQVDNPHWESGLATSIRAGIRAVPEDSAAALILLCDQPLIREQHLRALFEAWDGDPERIAAAGYGSGPGVPAIIPRKYFADMLKLTGDRGAKALLAGLGANVIQVPMPEAEADIDTQEDYAAILKRN
jgi:molybdenum cofactor cytidylyltransferase